MHRVEANGVDVHYFDVGSGPLVLLYHGFPDTAHSWLPVARRLAAEGYRAVAPNLRGYYPTSKGPDGGASLIDGGLDALGLMTALRAERAAIVGCDWGSLVAYAAAHLAPERIWKVAPGTGMHPANLSFSDPELLYRFRHFVVHQFRGLAELHARRNDWAYLNRLYRRWSPTWDFDEADLREVKNAFRAGGIGGPFAWYRSLAAAQVLASYRGQRDIMSRLTTVPALVWAGTADGATPARFTMGQEAFHIGGLTTRFVEGAGHFPHAEKPDETADLLLEFLGPAERAPRQLS